MRRGNAGRIIRHPQEWTADRPNFSRRPAQDSHRGVKIEQLVSPGWTTGRGKQREGSADAAVVSTMDAASLPPRSGLGSPPIVNRMVCEDCATVYYSAAARTMVEQDERCAKCGGKLVLAQGPRPERRPPGARRERAGGGSNG